MNYKKHYNNLINTRLLIKEERTILKKDNKQYFERHHIIPKSQGGTWKKENIVLLTAREHFIAHWLLTKFEPTRANINAFWRMCIGNNTPEKYKYSSIAYEEARIRFSESMKGHKINLGHKHSQETIEKMSKIKLGKAFSKETCEKISQNKLGKKQNRKKNVVQYDLEGNFIKKWNSANDASIELKINVMSIYLCVKNKRESYKGYKWIYEIN